MKLVSWNVNGLRSCLTKGFLEYVKQEDPDIVCLQETKLQPEQAVFELEGYHRYFHSADKKGYSGTAVLTKEEPLSVVYGFGDDVHRHEGRVITAEYPEFYLVCCYTPNSQDGLKRLDYRMQWEDDLRAYLLELDGKKPVIYCGDLNVAHQEMDLKNPRSNRMNPGFSDQEREKLTQLQKDYTILDGVKGRGHYVGTYIAHTSLERYWYGEGEMKFYIDGDEEYPTICGTGMEDYFGGSWSFAKQVDGKTVEQNYNTPFLGYPYYSTHDERAWSAYHNDDTLPQRGFYRWHILDPILFEEDLRVTLQQIGGCHKGNFERQDDVASVAYWYQSEPHQAFAPLLKKEERWPR